MTPNTSDLFLKSIIKEGLDGSIALIGFPYDIGLLRDSSKSLATGLDNGPDSLRRFLDKIGPIENAEYGVSLKDLKISDYGNIRIEGLFTLETLLEKLKQKCLNVLKKNGLSLTLGGSSDCAFGALSGLMEFKKENERVLALEITNRMDFKELYDGDKISAESMTRKLIESNKSSISKGELKVLYFGVDMGMMSEKDLDFLKENQDIMTIVPLKKIRKIQEIPMENTILAPITQAGYEFQRIIKEYAKNYDYIHVSFKLEAVNVKGSFLYNLNFSNKKAAYCPGVSKPSVIGGLMAEEAKEIVLLAGIEKKVASLDFSDYNPKYEDFRTGLLLANLIYYFAMGFKLRKL